jgi:aryl-alcohol dehydrogenase-like predicted oxidoreductase
MVDLGTNLVDTALIYGNSLTEEIFGEAIRGIRKKLIISTKRGIKLNAPGAGNWGASWKGIIVGCEESFRRLATDYIDILLSTGPPRTPPSRKPWAPWGNSRSRARSGASGF